MATFMGTLRIGKAQLRVRTGEFADDQGAHGGDRDDPRDRGDDPRQCCAHPSQARARPNRDRRRSGVRAPTSPSRRGARRPRRGRRRVRRRFVVRDRRRAHLPWSLGALHARSGRGRAGLVAVASSAGRLRDRRSCLALGRLEVVQACLRHRIARDVGVRTVGTTAQFGEFVDDGIVLDGHGPIMRRADRSAVPQTRL